MGFHLNKSFWPHIFYYYRCAQIYAAIPIISFENSWWGEYRPIINSCYNHIFIFTACTTASSRGYAKVCTMFAKTALRTKDESLLLSYCRIMCVNRFIRSRTGAYKLLVFLFWLKRLLPFHRDGNQPFCHRCLRKPSNAELLNWIIRESERKTQFFIWMYFCACD